MKKTELRTVKTYKWTVHFHDRKGKHFYYNRETGKSTVGKPLFWPSCMYSFVVCAISCAVEQTFRL